MQEDTPRNWRDELTNLLELDYGLLDDLVSRGLIEYEEQVYELEASASFLVQKSHALDWLGKNTTNHHLFLKALESTGQSHVACFLRQNGCEYSIESIFFCFRYRFVVWFVSFCVLLEQCSAIFTLYGFRKFVCQSVSHIREIEIYKSTIHYNDSLFGSIFCK